MENIYNQNEDLNKNYNLLKSKLENVLKKIKLTTDLKQAKLFLIEIQGEFKNIKLKREDREELYGKLQAAFAEINNKIENERLAFENESAKNYLILKPRIEDAEFLANHPKDYRESFEFLIEVQNQFKALRLQREQREVLYNRLQKAFEILKSNQPIYKKQEYIQVDINSDDIQQKVENVCKNIEVTEDYYDAKEQLIEVQSELKATNISREIKDELFDKIQKSFTIINLKREDKVKSIEEESSNHFDNFKNQIFEISERLKTDKDFKTIKEKLKSIQLELRDINLTKEHRKELFDLIQLNFEKTVELQDKEKGYFHKESLENYKSLRELVEKGYKQAETTHEYKDTREFLKKIQSEFKGIKLKSDEREELYSKLQRAFEILNTRVDEYFHTKKKNWEVRMQYKISEMITEIENLEDEIDDEKESLLELEDQLDIIISSGKQTIAKEGLMARITSSKISIQKKNEKIIDLENELEKLEERVNKSENEQDVEG
jgi:hypothetical protein